ncbi:MAG: helix-turn-helix domain-containing protein [Nocardioidaceae bacterium]
MSPHHVAALVFDDLTPFELGVLTEVFALPRPELDVPRWYDLTVCSQRPGELRAVGGVGINIVHGLEALAVADTVVVPGTADIHTDPPEEVLAAIRAAYDRGARLISICSGAFVLAAAGLLDGRPAATHWRFAERLAERFPLVHVNPDVLFVDDGRILTSAGTAAGIDLCLHVVRRDFGADIAGRVARGMVVAPHREGGQSQFIEAHVAPMTADDPIGRAVDWALEHLDESISVSRWAASAFMSQRTFTRRFTSATGLSPARWLLTQRIQASLSLLERSDEPVERIGPRVGIPTPAAFRRQFGRIIGVSPNAYRRTYRGDDRAASAPIGGA